MSLKAEETMRGSDGVIIVGFKLSEMIVTLMSAGQPKRRQVGVYPTREGVSLKLAQLVSIWKLSPLKTLSLKVQEPRSMPQITGVDFIIIKKQQKMALLIILILSIITLALPSQPTLTLYTHSWCPPCLKAKHIFSKIKAAYPSLSFQLLQYSNKTILYKSTSARTQADILPFPTLVFNCSGTKLTYQNELTFEQVGYWVETMCFQRLPQCSEKINEQLFHIAVRPHKNVKTLIQEMQKYPMVKICQAKHANFSQYQGLEILKLVKDKTLFLDYFSHNLRNYLIQSQKLAVALITKNSNSSKSKEFFATYLSLENFMDKKAQNQSFKIFNYDLKEEHKKQIIFLGLCYNDNTSKCVSEPLRKRQVLQAQSHIPKLLEFFNLNIDHLEQGQYIVAFRFRYPKFQTYIYHHSMGTIEQKFLFWIAQILQTKDKPKSQISRLCFWNSLVHRVSENSLEDIETYNYIENRLKMIREKYDKKISVNKFVKKFHNEEKFSLCLEGQLPKLYTSNKDIDAILEKVENQFSKVLEQDQETDL